MATLFVVFTFTLHYVYASFLSTTAFYGSPTQSSLRPFISFHQSSQAIHQPFQSRTRRETTSTWYLSHPCLPSITLHTQPNRLVRLSTLHGLGLNSDFHPQPRTPPGKHTFLLVGYHLEKTTSPTSLTPPFQLRKGEKEKCKKESISNKANNREHRQTSKHQPYQKGK